MTPPLEERIAKLARPDIFEADCLAAFSGVCGERLLFTLSTLLCPILSAPAGETPEDTYRLIGRNEVVTALWRRTQPKNTPHPHGENEETRR